MEEGLMGEFAKGKIDKAIKFLNQDKLSEDELKYCEQIISIIGEPIVKNQLQRMLDSKRLSKIDTINQKIKDMSYELEVLKEYQSKIVKDELKPVMENLKKIATVDIPEIEKELNKMKAPWTPGRVIDME